MNLLIIILICVVFIFIIIPLAISIYVTKSFIFPKMLEDDYCINESLLRKEYDNDILELPKNNFTIKSDYGYNLDGFIIDNNSENTVIFVHGITASRVGMYKYYSEFVKNGWNIIGYDHRHHGKSGGGCPSFGYYEKFDLKKITDYTFEKLNQTKNLLVYGESMGAGTVLQYLPIDERVTASVLDSPYSSLSTLMKYHIKEVKIPPVIRTIVFYLSKLFILLFGRFNINKVNPILDIEKINIPLIFFHSSGDSVVPSFMSKDMNDKYSNSSRVEIDCPDHTMEIVADRKKYLKELKNFINTKMNINFK